MVNIKIVGILANPVTYIRRPSVTVKPFIAYLTCGVVLVKLGTAAENPAYRAVIRLSDCFMLKQLLSYPLEESVLTMDEQSDRMTLD